MGTTTIHLKDGSTVHVVEDPYAVMAAVLDVHRSGDAFVMLTKRFGEVGSGTDMIARWGA